MSDTGRPLLLAIPRNLAAISDGRRTPTTTPPTVHTTC